jgi:hypothetical protein
MNIRRVGVITIATLALAGVFAGTAKAQEAVVKDAHFTLPFKATWDDTVLPPGDYTLSVIQLSGGRGVQYSVAFAGEGRRKTILVVRRPGDRVAKSSMLVAERGEEIYSIRALHLPSADLVLTFPAPNARQMFVAKAPEVIQSVPIQVVAK